MNAAEKIDESTGEVVQVPPAEVAAATMLGDLIALVVDELKAAKMHWSLLPQIDQDATLARIDIRCKDAVTRCVEIIAARACVSVGAEVESVTFKDGVKAVLRLSKGEGAHLLADSEGQTVRVVFADSEEFEGRGTAPKSQPDQRDMLGGDDAIGGAPAWKPPT